MTRLIAEFRPQSEVGKRLVNLPSTKFDATDAFLSLRIDEIKAFKHNNYDSDALSEGLCERKRHNGPFEVDVDVDAWLDLHGIERKSMTVDDLSSLRKKYPLRAATHKSIDVVYSARFKTRIEVPCNATEDEITVALGEINIPEDENSKYVEDSFDVIEPD